MSTAVETIDKLSRRITIRLPRAELQAEVEKRLKSRARTAKAPGFRPGKVPLKLVTAQYGFQVENEVLNEQLAQAFEKATSEHQLRVAGAPKIAENSAPDDAADALQFDATFEIYPEVRIGNFESLEVKKIMSEVGENDVDKTIEILRKQHVHYHLKGEANPHGDGGADQSAQSGDRVTIDFLGKIDGVEFQGGKAEDYVFVLGEGRMLPEFETAVIGLLAGQSKTFVMTFPADYHGKDVAGKTAEFTITLKRLEWAHVPAVDTDFARALGVENGDLIRLKADIKKNLEREVSTRTKAKTKDQVMNLLIQVSELDVPQVLISQDVDRLSEMTRRDMQQRGMNVNDMKLPAELFTQQAERRVRLGLILAEIVKTNQLQATSEQVRAQIDEFAQSYEDPQQVVKYYFGDRNRLAEVQALVLEENVVNYVLAKAKVVDQLIPFDELMAASAQA